MISRSRFFVAAAVVWSLLAVRLISGERGNLVGKLGNLGDLGNLGNLGNLRLNKNNPNATQRISRTPKPRRAKSMKAPNPNRTRLNAEKLEVSRALSRSKKNGRQLQEKSTSTTLQSLLSSIGVDRLLSVGIPAVGNLIEGLPSLLAGDWRKLGKKMNQESIPAVDAVLERLTSGRSLVNVLQTQLSDVNAVVDNIPKITMTIKKVDAEGEQVGQEIKFQGNLGNSGIFGIKGMLGNLGIKSNNSNIVFFESPLFNPLSYWLKPLGKMFGLGNMSQSQQAGLVSHMQSAGLAEQDVHLLGAQVDALTTMFSGGVQIPFVQSLSDVQNSFSQLMGSLGDVSYWGNAVRALQQLREDLIRLPVSWALNPDQNSIVGSSVGIIDQLLSRIGNNSGIIDNNFLADISKSLNSLAKTILPLDGTSLLPSVNVFGVDLGSSLGSAVENVLSIPLRLSDLSFLKNGFGIPSSVLEAFGSANSKPLMLGADAVSQLATMASPQFIPDLLARTFNAIPAMLGETVQVGTMLSSIADGLASSLQMSPGSDGSFFQRIGESVTGGSGLEDVLRRFLPIDNENASNMSPSEGQIMGLVKLLQLENAMNTVQNIINNLSGPSEYLSEMFSPKAVLDSFLSVFNIQNPLLGLSIEGSGRQSSSSGSSNLFDVLAGSFMSLPWQLADGVVNGVGRFAQLSKSLDIFKLFNSEKGRRRRLQATNEKHEENESDQHEMDLSEEEDAFVIEVDEFDDVSAALFSASVYLLHALSEIEMIAGSALEAPCMTEAEVEATSALRAAALIGNPADVLKAGKTSDAQMTELLGSGSSEGLSSGDPLTASSQFCEKRRSAVKLLGDWATEASEIMSNVFTESLVDSAESMESVIGNLTQLRTSAAAAKPDKNTCSNQAR